MEQIGNILKRYLSEIGIERPVLNYRAISVWPIVVGDRLSKVTHAKSIKNGKIFVQVDGALWRNEIIFSKQEIIEKLNCKLESNVVKDIIFI